MPPLSSKTCELSEEQAYEEVLTLCREGSRARTYRLRANAQESNTEPEVGFGKSLPESFVKWDRDSSSWKTFQASLFGGSLESFWGTWPRWGLMHNGSCYRRPRSAPHTEGSGSGLWPTPTARDGKCSDAPNRNGSPSLAEKCKWPTPRANDSEKRGQVSNDPRNGLPGAVIWRTPSAGDGSHGGPNARDSNGSLHLSAQAGGQLNPMWVEWLMGWPLDHTVLDSAATEWFRSKRSPRGKKSSKCRKRLCDN